MSLSIPAIFAAGLLTFASPCILPLMPIYLATIAGSSLERAKPGRTLLVATAFVLGLTTVFVVLGALASSLGAILVTHRASITLASGLLMLVFGARALGLLRVARLDRDARPGLTRVRAASTVLGAFLFGSAFALGWSPCIGPVLASVLTYAATHAESPLDGAFQLSVYSAGLALPLLVLAIAAERAAAWVKRARGVLPAVERLTGVALVALGLWTLAAAVGEPASVADRSIAHGAAAAPLAADGGEPGACELEGSPAATCALPALRAGATDALPVPASGARFLEFTARDCPACRRMRPVVETLVAACSELEAKVVRIDVTTPAGRALADRHRVRGTPTFVLVDEQGVERVRLLGENSGEALGAAVERAFGLSCWG